MDDLKQTTDLDTILDERGKRYGRFDDHATITQMLKAAMFGDFRAVSEIANKNGALANMLAVKELAADQREALEMIQHKIGRILNGDPNYSDSWRDIAGYAQLVADRLDGAPR